MRRDFEKILRDSADLDHNSVMDILGVPQIKKNKRKENEGIDKKGM